ncbi:hypothetical protein M0R45_034816 [Rubus argutus]|uniref:DNA-directed RNA polymerase subunit n=1 Tax=Rubus argutus TaxID=59490 RepID=A0AAW1VVQ1_RUBAR
MVSQFRGSCLGCRRRTRRSRVQVVFTLIMFRPFVGEIVTAKVIDSTADGLRLSLGFFDDICIPSHRLPLFLHHRTKRITQKCRNSVMWYWKPSDDEFSIDLKDQIRFQVESVNYPKILPEQPENSKPIAAMESQPFGLYRLKKELGLGINGLGPVHWWQDVDVEAS